MNDRTVVVELDGNLDLSRADAFEPVISDIENIDRLVINLSKATGIDSTFITQIMSLRRAYLRTGRDSVEIIVIAPPAIRRVLEITGVSSVVTVISE